MKTRIVPILSASFSSLFSPFVIADSPNWNYIEASYIQSEFDEIEHLGADLSEPDGFEIAGSLKIGDNFFVDLGYSEQDSDDMTTAQSHTSIFYGQWEVELAVERIDAGAGYIWALNESTDIYGRVGYEDWSVELSASRGYPVDEPGEIDDNGFVGAAGVRAVVWHCLELHGEVGYNDVVEEPTVRLGASFIFAEHFSIGGSFEKIDELEMLRATARYQF